MKRMELTEHTDRLTTRYWLSTSSYATQFITQNQNRLTWSTKLSNRAP